MRLNWKVTVFSIVCLGLFIRLGFWQLDRAGAKEALLEAQAMRQQMAPATISEIEAGGGDPNLRPVRTHGEYDEAAIFLLDNRVLEGVVGYEVLVPFQEAGSDQWLLVNRGFVPKGRTREDMPAIPPITDATATLDGEVYVAEYRSVASDVVSAPLGSATVVQVADPAVISRLSERALYPHLVRLRLTDPNALPRHWPITVMQPETHRGYAVQWFAMALAVVIAWSAFTFWRGPQNESGNQEAHD